MIYRILNCFTVNCSPLCCALYVCNRIWCLYRLEIVQTRINNINNRPLIRHQFVRLFNVLFFIPVLIMNRNSKLKLENLCHGNSRNSKDSINKSTLLHGCHHISASNEILKLKCEITKKSDAAKIEKNIVFPKIKYMDFPIQFSRY